MLENFGTQIGLNLSLANLFEIALLTWIFYKLLKWIYGTQAYQVFKGALFLIILLPLCEKMGLTTLSFLIRSIFTWLFISIVIIFQPELRSAFEKIGNSISINYFGVSKRVEKAEEAIDILVSSVKVLQETKTGALIVCEAETGLNDIAQTGTIIHAKLDEKLIETIFYKFTPLHDGAVIVSIFNEEIIAAGCFLPLTQRIDLPAQMGTRHRAALGISEQSDALTIIVSEETGGISTTNNRDYEYDISLERLKEILLNRFIVPVQNIQNRSFISKYTNKLTHLFKTPNGKQNKNND